VVERLVYTYFWDVFDCSGSFASCPCESLRGPLFIGKIASIAALNHVISHYPQKTWAVSDGSDNGFTRARSVRFARALLLCAPDRPRIVLIARTTPTVAGMRLRLKYASSKAEPGIPSTSKEPKRTAKGGQKKQSISGRATAARERGGEAETGAGASNIHVSQGPRQKAAINPAKRGGCVSSALGGASGFEVLQPLIPRSDSRL
jgi:hypothetical protein